MASTLASFCMALRASGSVASLDAVRTACARNAASSTTSIAAKTASRADARPRNSVLPRRPRTRSASVQPRTARRCAGHSTKRVSAATQGLAPLRAATLAVNSDVAQSAARHGNAAAARANASSSFLIWHATTAAAASAAPAARASSALRRASRVTNSKAVAAVLGDAQRDDATPTAARSASSYNTSCAKPSSSMAARAVTRWRTVLASTRASPATAVRTWTVDGAASRSVRRASLQKPRAAAAAAVLAKRANPALSRPVVTTAAMSWRSLRTPRTSASVATLETTPAKARRTARTSAWSAAAGANVASQSAPGQASRTEYASSAATSASTVSAWATMRASPLKLTIASTASRAPPFFATSAGFNLASPASASRPRRCTN